MIRERPIWMHVIFWGSAILVGASLAAFHVPFWVLLIAIVIMDFTLLPWYMIWRPHGK